MSENNRHLADSESMKVGRGNKLTLTKQAQRAVLNSVRDGRSMDNICQELNISRSTLFYYSQRDPIFAKKLEQARREAAHTYADKLIDVYDGTETMTDVKRSDGISKNLQWLASRRNPEAYGERLDVNHNVHVDMTIALNEGQSRLDKYLAARDVTPLESSTDSNNEVKSIVSANSDRKSDKNE